MSSKQVTQYNCDRCERVWYSEATELENKIELTATLDGVVTMVRFDCLCAGCRKTVQSLVKSMGKMIAKNSPIRGAKKKAEAAAGIESPATAPTLPTPADSTPLAVELSVQHGRPRSFQQP